MSSEKRKMISPRKASRGVLDGIRVIELGQLIAGPFCGKILGEFGAEVIKIESVNGGDPLRKWRALKKGTSLWWQVQSKNKKSVALDLRTEQGQEIVRLLVRDADVIIENFKPGTMEGWNLGWQQLSEINPRLIMLRVSGFGQDGPYRDKPGFGALGEAIGGLRYLTGEPGQVPVRTGVAIGDTVAALHGALGVLLALYQRDVRGGGGQVIDVALYESVFNCMDSLLPDYTELGLVRQPAGSSLPGVVPSNAYMCSDGVLVIAGNGDSIFRRLMSVIGRVDLAQDERLATNDGRVGRVSEIDAAISSWAVQKTVNETLQCLESAGVPVSKIYTAKDIAEDPHYKARGMINRIQTSDGYEVSVPGVVPKLSLTPGTFRTPAPALGADTRAVLAGLGLSEDRVNELVRSGIVR
jgi:formyl-CoA transferase